MNDYLKSASKLLSKQSLYVTHRDENILEVSIDEKTRPFCFLIIEEEQFAGIILSLAVDCHDTYLIADLVINLMHIIPIAMGEPFFYSNNGKCYWDNDAYKQYELEANDQLLELPPMTETRH